MYNEGFYDLTLDDNDCVVNSAKFTATINVNDVVKNIEFYTSNGLTDFPSDVLWVETIVNNLKTFDGIGDVIVDYTTNTIQIFNSCDTTGSTCVPQNINTLSDVKVIINLLISYDISCVSCDI
jgi:hypothetical protein